MSEVTVVSCCWSLCVEYAASFFCVPLIMKIHTDPLCSKCREEEETAYHVLDKYMCIQDQVSEQKDTVQ